MSISFRLATAADAQACNAFHRAFSRKSRTPAQWQWEFNERHADRPILYALAVDGDTIVGSQALIRVPMRGPDGIIQTAKGEDTLIAPRYWGKSILRPLFDLLIEHAQAERIRLLWGFNAARATFKKIGFRYLDDNVLLLIRPLSAAALGRIASHHGSGRPRATHRLTWRHRIVTNPLGAHAVIAATQVLSAIGTVTHALRRQDITVNVLDQVPSSIEGLVARFTTQTRALTVDRSPQFLQWRLAQNAFVPSTLMAGFRNGEMVGFASFCITPDLQGIVTDLIALDEDTTFTLLASATRRLRDAGAERVQTLLTDKAAASVATLSAARRLGYVRVPTNMGACVLPLDGAPPEEALLRTNNWHFTNINTEGRQG